MLLALRLGRLRQSKPGIVFGDVWLGACPVTKRISTVTECRAFVSQLDEFKFSSAELGDFWVDLKTSDCTAGREEMENLLQEMKQANFANIPLMTSALI